MEELGYLDDPADRLGMLDGQRMRAARVVLDIGVHLGKPYPGGRRASGTPTNALAFMRDNVNMNDEFVRFEVNRYLGWPGQAPSYKVGQRIWEDLRAERAAATAPTSTSGTSTARARARRRRPRHPASGPPPLRSVRPDPTRRLRRCRPPTAPAL